MTNDRIIEILRERAREIRQVAKVEVLDPTSHYAASLRGQALAYSHAADLIESKGETP